MYPDCFVTHVPGLNPSGSTSPVVPAMGVKFVQCGFGFPPPGNGGGFKTLPADVTLRHSRSVIGKRSPGFTTMCFALL
jgi:hypothetical protein